MGNPEGKSSYLSSVDLKGAFKVAEDAVKQGRACLMDFFGKNHNVERKEKAGLVSDADKTSEKIIKEILKRGCPDFDFLGEETYFSQSESVEKRASQKSSKKPRWILDPLDGTTNYLHQLPMWCISLALEVDEQIQIGIIDVPMMNQTFTALRGQGAYCNGKRISVSKCESIGEAFMTTGFVADYENVISEQLKIFSHMVRQAEAIRRPGAAAYDLALIAAGSFDVYWERNISPWDVAAGILLVEEAGGACVNYAGEKYDAFQNNIVAGNKKMTAHFTQELQKIL